MGYFHVTDEERKHLRELAKKQLEYSMFPVMREREKLWYKHNDLKGEIPMIHFETWTFENDILPELKCTSEAARNIELQINREILSHECVGDDRIVSPHFNIGWDIDFKLFDLKVEREHSKDTQGRDLGHKFKYYIQDLQGDKGLLKPSTFAVNREKTVAWKTFAEEILGDILPVKMNMGSLVACLSQDIVHIMGMETMIYSMMDYPEEFTYMMERISNDYTALFKWMETENLLILNNGNSGVGNGTFGFTTDLPSNNSKNENKVTTKDVWGFMDSQETVSISPQMFGEFFFPYYNEVAKNFGLLSYGCCEPVHTIWEKYISKLPNLRKLSISPWCDEEFMGQALAGSNVIYHRKPSPNFVGVGKDLDEEAFRQHILKTINCAKGCKLEFSFRDVYTLDGNIEKPRRAVEITRELVEKYWR
jgi:hypothetical protein